MFDKSDAQTHFHLPICDLSRKIRHMYIGLAHYILYAKEDKCRRQETYMTRRT